MTAEPGLARVLAFDPARALRESAEEARARGLRPPSPDERDSRRLDAAVYLSQHGDERQRLLAIAYLGKVVAGRV